MNAVIEIAKFLGVASALYALFIFATMMLVGAVWVAGSLF